MERYLGLHERIEITYVVDGYEVELMTDDGDTLVFSAKGETINDAMNSLLEIVSKVIGSGKVRTYAHTHGQKISWGLSTVNRSEEEIKHWQQQNR